jgi:hypothetical protein
MTIPTRSPAAGRYAPDVIAENVQAPPGSATIRKTRHSVFCASAIAWSVTSTAAFLRTDPLVFRACDALASRDMRRELAQVPVLVGEHDEATADVGLADAIDADLAIQHQGDATDFMSPTLNDF